MCMKNQIFSVSIFIIVLILIAFGFWQLSEKSSSPETNMPILETLEANATVNSPLVVRGRAPGSWFFEGSLPIMLKDSQGNTIASAPGQAEGEWMTNGMVTFEATLEFDVPTTQTCILVVAKDNPSGLPENADSYSIPIKFQEKNNETILPYKSGVRGIVQLSPTCPVESIPPEPQCAAKPYEADVFIQNNNKIFATTHAWKDGKFTISIPPGTYNVTARRPGDDLRGSPVAYPICKSLNIIVEADSYIDITINCDTGIR